MPRITSTSCITGTGFMKCRPMNRSGRSVLDASRVIEIDEVFEARIVSGFSTGTRVAKIWFFTASRSVAASMIRSFVPRSVRVSVVPIRPSASSRAVAVIFSRET